MRSMVGSPRAAASLSSASGCVVNPENRLRSLVDESQQSDRDRGLVAGILPGDERELPHRLVVVLGRPQVDVDREAEDADLDQLEHHRLAAGAASACSAPLGMSSSNHTNLPSAVTTVPHPRANSSTSTSPRPVPEVAE